MDDARGRRRWTTPVGAVRPEAAELHPQPVVRSFKAQAHYADGVLTLRIPVAEQAMPRNIEITRGQDKLLEIDR
ncbi:Hsp20/alpha crystallin family protein [Arthrobacter sp. RHLT1-20]